MPEELKQLKLKKGEALSLSKAIDIHQSKMALLSSTEDYMLSSTMLSSAGQCVFKDITLSRIMNVRARCKRTIRQPVCQVQEDN